MLNEPLVNLKDILLAPLHIKLGLVYNYIKTLNKNDRGNDLLEAKKIRCLDITRKLGVYIFFHHNIIVRWPY